MIHKTRKRKTHHIAILVSGTDGDIEHRPYNHRVIEYFVNINVVNFVYLKLHNPPAVPLQTPRGPKIQLINVLV